MLAKIRVRLSMKQLYNLGPGTFLFIFFFSLLSVNLFCRGSVLVPLRKPIGTCTCNFSGGGDPEGVSDSVSFLPSLPLPSVSTRGRLNNGKWMHTSNVVQALKRRSGCADFAGLQCILHVLIQWFVSFLKGELSDEHAHLCSCASAFASCKEYV